jgi:hypothetical protein
MTCDVVEYFRSCPRSYLDAHARSRDELATLHWLAHNPTDALPPGPLSELICSWVGAHLESRDCEP